MGSACRNSGWALASQRRRSSLRSPGGSRSRLPLHRHRRHLWQREWSRKGAPRIGGSPREGLSHHQDLEFTQGNESTEKALEESLRLLNTPYVDLLLIRCPVADCTSTPEKQREAPGLTGASEQKPGSFLKAEGRYGAASAESLPLREAAVASVRKIK